MTTHVVSVLVKSIRLSNTFRPTLNRRNITSSGIVLTKKYGSSDEKPENVFIESLKKKSHLTQRRVDELTKLSQNAFTLFGFDEKFDLNTGKLQQEMRKLQQLLHPDKVFEADKPIRDQAYHLSALVNDFYDILNHPYKRAKYLLSIVLKKSQNEIEEDLDKLKIEDEFLVRMMNLREKLEDPKTEHSYLVRVEYELTSELEMLLKELNKNFESKNLSIILIKLGKLKFLANCHQIVTDRIGSFSRF